MDPQMGASSKCLLHLFSCQRLIRKISAIQAMRLHRESTIIREPENRQVRIIFSDGINAFHTYCTIGKDDCKIRTLMNQPFLQQFPRIRTDVLIRLRNQTTKKSFSRLAFMLLSEKYDPRSLRHPQFPSCFQFSRVFFLIRYHLMAHSTVIKAKPTDAQRNNGIMKYSTTFTEVPAPIPFIAAELTSPYRL